MKVYITDFVEDLNYRKVILYIGDVNKDVLYKTLKHDEVNHLNRFEGCKDDNFMYIENCDLQTLDFDILDYLSEGYIICPLYQDSEGYYVYIDLYMKGEIS